MKQRNNSNSSSSRRSGNGMRDGSGGGQGLMDGMGLNSSPDCPYADKNQSSGSQNKSNRSK